MSQPAIPEAGKFPRLRTSVDARQLTWILAWAVVFCDIGTSVYYVPGILYEQVGNLAPVFVAMVMACFVLLAIKYIEICWKNPEGGGVVTVASKAFGPRWGALGGMLITVDYFLTSSISTTSAFYYVGSLFPVFSEHVVACAGAGILFLAVLNLVGIRESATVSLGMAIAALVTNSWVLSQTVAHLGWGAFDLVRDAARTAEGLTPRQALIGFSAAWLAFSGLESIAQLSPTIRTPVRRNARFAMIAVIVTVLLTSPTLTLFSVGLLTNAGDVETERFISELGAIVGGTTLKLAVVLTATSLLLFAANTAMIGGYHVFLALSTQGFLPKVILTRNRRFGTPHVAILITAIVPLFVVLATGGRMVLLGEMYAFGLLGAFVLDSVGIDVLRWRSRERGALFWVGILTSAFVLVAWSVNLFAKPLATFFGGGITLLGMSVAIGLREGWITDTFYRLGYVGRRAARAVADAERLAEAADIDILSVAQANEIRPLFPSSTLVAIRGNVPNLIREACARVRGRGESAVYCVFVEEVPGLFLSSHPLEPNPDGVLYLQSAVREARQYGVDLVPIWMVSYNAAEAIARAAETLEVDAVIVGVSRRTAIYHLLRGHVVRGLTRELPANVHLILCN